MQTLFTISEILIIRTMLFICRIVEYVFQLFYLCYVTIAFAKITGIWLLQPILSLIDTSVVGMTTSDISQLASLGPSIAWIDSSSYLFQVSIRLQICKLPSYHKFIALYSLSFLTSSWVWPQLQCLQALLKRKI